MRFARQHGDHPSCPIVSLYLAQRRSRRATVLPSGTFDHEPFDRAAKDFLPCHRPREMCVSAFVEQQRSGRCGVADARGRSCRSHPARANFRQPSRPGPDVFSFGSKYTAGAPNRLGRPFRRRGPLQFSFGDASAVTFSSARSASIEHPARFPKSFSVTAVPR